jgi:adenosylhomocysteine nucleosidase
VPGMPASFHADEALMEAALAYGASVAAPDGWAVRPGLIASSDAFMTADRVIGVRRAFADVVDVDAVDMESMAIAQTCHVHRVPFVSVRGVSDLAGPDAHDVHDENLALTAGRSADVALALVRGLAGR